jgi:hypothetical protein
VAARQRAWPSDPTWNGSWTKTWLTRATRWIEARKLVTLGGAGSVRPLCLARPAATVRQWHPMTIPRHQARGRSKLTVTTATLATSMGAREEDVQSALAGWRRGPRGLRSPLWRALSSLSSAPVSASRRGGVRRHARVRLDGAGRRACKLEGGAEPRERRARGLVIASAVTTRAGRRPSGVNGSDPMCGDTAGPPSSSRSTTTAVPVLEKVNSFVQGRRHRQRRGHPGKIFDSVRLRQNRLLRPRRLHHYRYEQGPQGASRPQARSGF